MNIPYIKNLQSGATVHPVNRFFSASGEQTHTDTEKTQIYGSYMIALFAMPCQAPFYSASILFGL